MVGQIVNAILYDCSKESITKIKNIHPELIEKNNKLYIKNKKWPYRILLKPGSYIVEYRSGQFYPYKKDTFEKRKQIVNPRDPSDYINIEDIRKYLENIDKEE